MEGRRLAKDETGCRDGMVSLEIWLLLEPRLRRVLAMCSQGEEEVWLVTFRTCGPCVEGRNGWRAGIVRAVSLRRARGLGQERHMYLRVVAAHKHSGAKTPRLYLFGNGSMLTKV